jgi:RNA polymerase sigma factor (sigma-70 family)
MGYEDMPLRGSVSHLVERVKSGCESAATVLWNRYQQQLLGFARSRLRSTPRRVADEEDVVIAAFQSFLRRTRRGEYPHLRGRGELWRLLATITASKAANLIRRERSEKRGGGRVVLTSVLTSEPDSVAAQAFAELATPEPNPLLIVMMNDSLDHLLSQLQDDELRAIAVAKLHGNSNEEIARQTQRSIPTVERRLRLIRDTWREELNVEAFEP